MKVTFLGTGTSMGIPMIGCNCIVCNSDDPKDRRLRTSVWIENDGMNIIIDTGIDFRQQALREKLPLVDAVLFTHHHVDHIFGLDELRPINFLQKRTVKIYATAGTLEYLKRIYPYVFEGNHCPSDIPKIDYYAIDTKPFNINKLSILPISLIHGDMPVLGFRIGNFAYCTDVNKIPWKSYQHLKNLDVLVLGALRNSPHPTHFTLAEAVAEANKIGAKRTYFVHMSHELTHQQMMKQLPENAQPAFDGLTIELESI
jgi:phosphoribosyl 1,2-cyclic phosphate phosphodiesterase